MMLTTESIVVASKAQLSATMQEETIIAGLWKGNYYGLSAVGVRIWQLIQSPIALHELLRTIAEEYDVSEERCRADVLALLEQMAEEGLIEVDRAHAS